MAWQRVGCSHDGGSNVLGQAPIDYAATSPRGPGRGVVDDDTYRPGGLGNIGSPRGGGGGGGVGGGGQGGGGNTDRGGYGRRKEAPREEPREDPSGPNLTNEPKSRRSVDESLTIIIETMGNRKDRYGNPIGKLGLKALREKFVLFDDTKEKRDEGKAMLNWQEFYTGIVQQQGYVKDANKKLNKSEIYDIFRNCDVDRSGNLSVAEFLANIVKTVLPPSCKENVEVVFEQLDMDGSGYIDVKEIKKHYKVTENPNVKNGKLTEAEAFAEYISSFEPEFLQGERNESDSKITEEEWIDYYAGVFREYAAGYGRTPAINAFNTLIKATYRDFGKGTKSAFADEKYTYKQMNLDMKAVAL